MQRLTGVFLLVIGVFFAVLGAVVLFMIPELGAGGVLIGVAILFIICGVMLAAPGARILRGLTGGGVLTKGATVGNYVIDEPQSRQHEGQAYEVFYQQPVKGKNRRPSSLVVRVPIDTRARLQFDQENWFDRICKRMGLAREHQTGEADFDQAVYVRGPSDGYAEHYLMDAKKREAILALKEQGFPQVKVTDGRVEAIWQGFDPEVDDAPNLPSAAAQRLFTLADALPDWKSHPDTDGGELGHVGIWALAVVFACTFGAYFLFRPVHEWTLLWSGLGAFVLAYPVFAWLAALCLRGNSLSHDRWARVAGVGIILVALGSIGSLAAFNALADASEPTEHQLTISSKRSASGRRGSRSYYVTVPDWDRRGDVEFSVSSSEYNTLASGRSKLHLTTHRGALNIEWIKQKRFEP